MHRRTFLATSGVAIGAATAGCGGLFDGGSSARSGRPATLEDPPDAVYHPTHMEGMEMAEMASAGRYRFALTYSFPHPFWQVTAGRVRRVDVTEDDSAHVMLSVWDDETGTPLPVSEIDATFLQDGEVLTEPTMWLMLSQNMGVHFGDNVPLAGDGTYQVEADYPPIDARLLGALQDLGESASVEFEMEFSRATLDELPFEQFDERAGERDALAPMEMDVMPTGQLPGPADLPGDLLGEGTTGDAVLAVTALERPPAGLDTDGTYLAVSARTPYNRYPIPRMALDASIDGEGSMPLDPGIHEDLGYHYGTVVDEIPEGAELTITVASASTAARHEGYETAFLEFEPVTASL